MKNKINLWPIAIILMLTGAVIGGYKTISLAIENPVEQSSIFLEGYHQTDKNINQILEDKLAFDSKYQLDISQLELNKNTISGKIKLLKKDDLSFVNANFELLLTRPETTVFDKRLKTNDEVNFDLPKKGRWIIHLKVTTKNNTGYFSLGLNTAKPNEILILNPFVSQVKLKHIQQEKEARIKRLSSNLSF
jgi:hypothetical protein